MTELRTRLEHLTAALADRYRLERQLGEGGMATVYLAHDLRHDRQVALQVLKPEIAAALGAQRFLKEHPSRHQEREHPPARWGSAAHRLRHRHRSVRGGGNRLTETALSIGTEQYMSPEQATGERDLDARSDIYALGAVTYEMLAGEPPVTGPTARAMISKLMANARHHCSESSGRPSRPSRRRRRWRRHPS